MRHTIVVALLCRKTVEGGQICKRIAAAAAPPAAGSQPCSSLQRVRHTPVPDKMTVHGQRAKSTLLVNMSRPETAAKNKYHICNPVYAEVVTQDEPSATTRQHAELAMATEHDGGMSSPGGSGSYIRPPSSNIATRSARY